MHANECATICLNNRVTSKTHFTNYPYPKSASDGRWLTKIDWTELNCEQSMLLLLLIELNFTEKVGSELEWCQKPVLGVSRQTFTLIDVSNYLATMWTSTRNLTHSFIRVCASVYVIYKTECQDFNTIIYDFVNAGEREIKLQDSKMIEDE